MISWNLRRQLTILFGILVLIGLIAGFFYYRYKPVETCFDGLQGRGELGIDCGGVCQKVCTNEVSALLVQWTKLLPVRVGQYDVAAFISNPNSLFIIRKLDYVVKVFDENNILISERYGTTYAGSRDEFVIYEPQMDVGQKIPRRATIELAEPIWERLSKPSASTILVRNQTYVEDPNPLVTAEVVNSGVRPQRNLEVAAVLMDASRNVFAVSRTVIDQLDPQHVQDILFGWPQSFAVRPSFIELYPHYVREDLVQ